MAPAKRTVVGAYLSARLYVRHVGGDRPSSGPCSGIEAVHAGDGVDGNLAQLRHLPPSATPGRRPRAAAATCHCRAGRRRRRAAGRRGRPGGTGWCRARRSRGDGQEGELAVERQVDLAVRFRGRILGSRKGTSRRDPLRVYRRPVRSLPGLAFVVESFW